MPQNGEIQSLAASFGKDGKHYESVKRLREWLQCIQRTPEMKEDELTISPVMKDPNAGKKVDQFLSRMKEMSGDFTKHPDDPKTLRNAYILLRTDHHDAVNLDSNMQLKELSGDDLRRIRELAEEVRRHEDPILHPAQRRAVMEGDKELENEENRAIADALMDLTRLMTEIGIKIPEKGVMQLET